MTDTSRTYIDALSAAKLANVNIATIRRLCKKVLKSSDPKLKDVVKKEFEIDSPRFIYLIDKDFVINHWDLGAATTETSKASPDSQPVENIQSTSYLDRALNLMESTVKTLEQQNIQLMSQNNELKEQNKQFYSLLSEMNRRGFFLDAPKPAGATTNGQATTFTESQPTEEPKQMPKKGFFARVFGR